MRMTDTPYDAAMTRGKQELARQLVDANDEIERLRNALEMIEVMIADHERLLLLPDVKDIKKIWKIARDALCVVGRQDQ